MFPHDRQASHPCRSVHLSWASDRIAARQTISVLQRHGLDIKAEDSFGNSPLSLAIKHFDVEPYILEELLQAGAVTSTRFDAKHGSTITHCAKAGVVRPYDTRRVQILLP